MTASTLLTRPGYPILLVVLILVFTPRTGAAQWVTDGIPAATSPLAQSQPCVAPDGAGGAFVGWIEASGGGAPPTVEVQHFDAVGNRLWGATGIQVCNTAGNRADPVIVPDGEGGCVVAWDDYRNVGGVPYGSDIYAQRVSFLGTPLWAANGVAVVVNINDQKFPRMIAGAGGTAFLTWQDLRTDTGDIYVQKLAADGGQAWGAGGIAACTATDLQLDPDIVSDGEGGVIVCWTDIRSGFGDVYAQRINFLGAPSWTANGVAISATSGIQSNPDMIAHPLGGAMIVWEDQRPPLTRDIYAQRVDAAGVAQWTANGVVVCDYNDVQRNAQITSDGGNGGIVTWADFRDDGPGQIRAQRIDVSGARQWASDGIAVAVTTSSNFEPQIVSNGVGGAIISWYGYYDMAPGNEDVYVQQLDAAGSPLWAANGIPVCTATGGQSAVRMAAAGSGAAVVAWEDTRGPMVVYAQRVPFGIPSGVGDGAVPDAGLVVQANAPNPFNAGTSFRVHVGAPSDATVGVFDVAGRRVATRHLALATGWQTIRFDGRDDAGAQLPAGVYFHRMRASGQTVTRKMLILR